MNPLIKLTSQARYILVIEKGMEEWKGEEGGRREEGERRGKEGEEEGIQELTHRTDGIFQRLCEDRIHQKIPCVLICGKG